MLLNSEGPRVSLLRHCSHTTTVDTYKKATLYFTFYAACPNPSVHQSRISHTKLGAELPKVSCTHMGQKLSPKVSNDVIVVSILFIKFHA